MSCTAREGGGICDWWLLLPPGIENTRQDTGGVNKARSWARNLAEKARRRAAVKKLISSFSFHLPTESCVIRVFVYAALDKKAQIFRARLARVQCLSATAFENYNKLNLVAEVVFCFKTNRITVGTTCIPLWSTSMYAPTLSSLCVSLLCLSLYLSYRALSPPNL